MPWVRGAFSAPVFRSFRRNSRVFRAGACHSAGKQLRAVRLRPADAGRKSCTAVIYFDEADGEILPGSLLSGTAKFTTAQEKHLRGKDYDLSRGVFLTASCRETLHAKPGRASVWLAPALFAERLRAAIQSAFPSDTAGFVQALLLGDKTGLRYEDQNDLAIAGIYHAVAVSGMHVSILLGMILLLCGGNHRLAAALGLPAAVFLSS